ncbi:MAG: LysM peptidoglycan-binding domain-containing protein [Bacteroidia bacterium]
MATLVIEAYAKDDYSSKVGSWSGDYDPPEVDLSFQNAYVSNPSMGFQKPPSYAGEKPADFEFPLVFDNSLDMDRGKKITPIKTQVADFQKIAFTLNGTSHQPNFLIITCGDFLFKGQATSLTVKYGSFWQVDGNTVPTRALVTLKVRESLTTTAQKSEAKVSSPDLTHSVVVREGDSLASLSQKYYGSPLYYIELAEVNQITNFRTLKAGMRIVIPPLEK